MSSLFDSLSEELFQILKGSGKTLTLYGSDGNKTYDPKKARRFFAVPGNMMASVIEAGSDSEVKLYLSASTDIKAISHLINTLRQVTTRYNVMFNVRKYGRELEPKDFAYQAMSMNEAPMWGSTKTSYQRIGECKLIVRHTVPVREGVIGARGRNILSMFVETKQGERFKFPANHLSGGRAFAQHINQGGMPHDVIGTQVSELALESLQLSQTARYIHHCRNILDEAAIELRPLIKNRIYEVRKAFMGMSRPRGYTKVTEAGLPLIQANLMEGQDGEIARLQTLLQIDSNHSLAEALKPVALLILGEQMTNMNNPFQGVIVLDEDVADALVEALADEYGHEAGWTRSSANMTFSEQAAYADACDYLNLIEAAYMVNENNQILAFAQDWIAKNDANNGHDTIGAGDMTTGDKKAIENRANDLAAGIEDIILGRVPTPDYPENMSLNFSSPEDKQRVFIGLFVDAGVLPNDSTANFVSSIVSKMEHGKKLSPNERFVAKTLSDQLASDLGEGLDETMGDDWDRYAISREGDWEFQLEYILDELTPEEVLNYGGNEWVVDGDDPSEFDPLSRAVLIDDTQKLIYNQLENTDAYASMPRSDEFLKSDATDFVDKYVLPHLQAKGIEVTEGLDEFAQFEDKPEHHGIAAGDHVATDMGPAQVISVEGDMASVEFLHGGAKTMHVDDLEKVPELAGFGEEADLAEWFDSFDPESVLERIAPKINWENGIPKQEKKTVDGFDPTIHVGDRVTHGVYGSGEVVADNGKFVKVKFDHPHPRLPETQTVTLSPGTLTKAGGATLDEAGEPMYHSVFSQHDDGTWGHHFDADDAEDAKDEMRFIKTNGGKAMTIKVPKSQADWTQVNPNDFVQAHLAKKAKPAVESEGEENPDWDLDHVLSKEPVGEPDHLKGMNFRKMRGQFKEGTSKTPTATGYIEWNGEEDVEVEVEYSIDDGTFATGLDYPKFHSYGETVDIDSVVIKATGEDVRDQLSSKQLSALQQYCIDDARERDEYERDQAADYARDSRYDESFGGDQGEDLIKDTKVDHEEEVDESFQAELNALLKNARFRGF